ncbi:MAG: hypothetical protein ACXVCN_08930 [Bdellovibrio sp.]
MRYKFSFFSAFKCFCRSGKLTALAILMLTLFFQSSSFGEDSPSEKSLFWNEIFASEDLTGSPRDIGTLYKVDPTCRDSVVKISNWVSLYGEEGRTDLFMADKTASLDRIFDDITGYLEKLGPSDKCFTIAIKSYYLSSFELLLQGLRPKRIHPYISSLGPALLGLYLAEQGKVEINSGQPSFGSEQKDHATGGYSCMNSTIHLFVPQSLSLLPRPIDAGTIFSHELDHLLRDKSTSLEVLKQMFPAKSATGLDWNAVLLLDESLSVILTATQQRQSVEFIHLKPVKDLSLVRKDGNFAQLNNNMASVMMNGSEIFWPSSFYSIVTRFFSIFDSSNKELDRILNYISKSYAIQNPSKSSSNPDQNTIYQKLKRQTALNPPFADHYWPIGRHRIEDDYFHANKKIIPIPERKTPAGFSDFFKSRKDAKNIQVIPLKVVSGELINEVIDAGPFLLSLSRVANSLNQESALCRALEFAISNKEIQSYAGLQVAQELAKTRININETGNATQPEDHEVKPDGNGVKPDGNEVKPDGNGVKPDGNEVKPDGNGLRPDIVNGSNL